MTNPRREAIVNASPLIYLDKINKLELLGKIYGKVWVTTAVLKEVSSGKGGETLRSRIHGFRWIKIVKVAVIPPELMEWDLGEGETSIIAWARKHPGPMLVLDDRAAYSCASLYGLKVTGTLGVLLAAKDMGLLKEIKSSLMDLKASGCWLSAGIVKTALELAGEDD